MIRIIVNIKIENETIQANGVLISSKKSLTLIGINDNAATEVINNSVNQTIQTKQNDFNIMIKSCISL